MRETDNVEGRAVSTPSTYSPGTSEPGQRGIHAEINGVGAAQDAGLTPTAVAPSRPACPDCIRTLTELDVEIIDP